MSTHFFTNDDERTLIKKFEAVFANNPQITLFDVLVGYFRSSGYFKLRPFLENIKQIRILVGIDVDKLTKDYQQRGLSLQTDGDKQAVVADYTSKLKDEINGADYDETLEASILQFMRDVESGKIVLKAHPTRKLHAKIYIFRPDNFTPDTMSCEVITGSSNLTEAGLGIKGSESNYEFNVSLRNYEDVKFATDEFERLWAEGVDVLPAIIKEVKNGTFLKDDFSPYELYHKLLIEYFDTRINFNPDDIRDLPKDFKRLKYQLDAVLQGFEILKKHNGFFMSDVVGLGKTIMAILIARQYFYTNNYPNYASRTLIIAPPALLRVWKESVEKFDLTHVSYTSSGNLKTITEPSRYDLVIVDESHKFRNDTSEAYKLLQVICKTPCRDESEKKVILLSATPLNNRPQDIRNQVLLFQDGITNTIGIDLMEFFGKMEKQYKALIKEDAKHVSSQIEVLYSKIRDKVIQPLTIRRIRSDLTANAEYAQDLEEQGITFPHVHPPEKLLYELEDDISKLYDETLVVLSDKKSGLQYSRYRVIEFLKPLLRKDFTHSVVMSEQLAGIIKTLMLKRLDSSFRAFYSTLCRITTSYEMMLNMISNNRIYIISGYDVTDYLAQGREDELERIWEEEHEDNRKAKKLTLDDFEAEFAAAIEADYEKLTPLKAKWEQVIQAQEEDPRRDAKLAKFLSVLDTELLAADKNPEQKLIIFSESKVTTDYISQQLASNPQYKVLSVHGSNIKGLVKKIANNFDANVEPAKQEDEYNIIITTEVLAEGVNLHRSNTVLNYDTPWNSTRLMQRIGRVNRIGTKAEEIFIYNFFPTEKVEGELNLRRRAQNKLQAFHSALGEDSQIYSTDEMVGSFGLFDEAPDEAEFINEELKYLMEIRAFRQAQPEMFERIKNLPLKIRNAVTNAELHEQTISFLRNEHNNAFYCVSKDLQVEELGFLEVAPIFKAAIEADAVPLHPQHHAQVQRALAHFHKDAAAQIVREQLQTQQLNPQQQQAVAYLRALAKSTHASESQKQKISEAMTTTKAGRFQQLTIGINRLSRAAKKTKLDEAVQIKRLMELLDQFHTAAPDPQPSQKPQKASSPPQVIITQSYHR